MRALYVAVAALTAVCAVWWISTGVRQWHNVGRPLSYWLRNGLMTDQAARAGYDRGCLVLGAWSALCAILTGMAAFAGVPSRGREVVLIAIYGVVIAGILACTALFMTIMYVNRPGWLVPPHLRSEPGAYAARRQDHRRRRERRPGRTRS